MLLNSGIKFLITYGEDGQGLNLTPAQVQSFYIVENIKQSVPTFSFNFMIGGDIVSNINISDGSLLTFKITNSNVKKLINYKMSFRTFNVPLIKTSSNLFLYSINGVLNTYKYVFERKLGCFKGNSYDAIKSIAAECGLTYSSNINNTNDSMNWPSNLFSYAKLSNYISSYGWIDNSSSMVIGLTANRKLKYNDINHFSENNIDAVLYLNATSNIPKKYKNINRYRITDAINKSLSGTLNTGNIYGYELTQHTLNNEIKTYKTVDALRHTLDFDINQNLYNEINNVKLKYAPIDCGNTHPNFSKAYHQNQRIKALFPISIEMITNEPTNLELLSKVYVDVVNSVNKNSKTSTSGLYLIVAKTIAIIEGFYYEKFLAVTTGFNTPNSGDRI